jgi:hypothetical protein
MAELAASTMTSSRYEDVIVGAMQFFGAEDWRATDHTAGTVVLHGRPRIPWYMLLMTLGFLAFVAPGVALYLLHARKAYWFASIVVTATPIKGGTDVVIQYGSPARRREHCYADAGPASRPIRLSFSTSVVRLRFSSFAAAPLLPPVFSSARAMTSRSSRSI